MPIMECAKCFGADFSLHARHVFPVCHRSGTEHEDRSEWCFRRSTELSSNRQSHTHSKSEYLFSLQMWRFNVPSPRVFHSAYFKSFGHGTRRVRRSPTTGSFRLLALTARSDTVKAAAMTEAISLQSLHGMALSGRLVAEPRSKGTHDSS